MARETQPLYTAKINKGMSSPVAVGPATGQEARVESAGFFGFRADAAWTTGRGVFPDRAVVKLNEALQERGKGILVGDTVLPGRGQETRPVIKDTDQVRLTAEGMGSGGLKVVLHQGGEVVDSMLLDAAGDTYFDVRKAVGSVIVDEEGHYSFGDAGTAAAKQREQGYE